MPSFKAGQPPIDLTEDGRKPWERQGAESEKRFAQFAAFRDQGAARTLAQTAKTLALAPSYVRNCAVHYRWQERADAWDREQARLFAARMAADRRTAARTHIALGSVMFGKIRERLASLDARTMTATETARMAEVALKLHLSGLGLPDSTVQVIGDPTQPIAHQDVNGMSFAERQALLDRITTELQRRRGIAAPGDYADPDDGDTGG